MTPAARVQAAIEILDEVIASARDDGPPADAIVQRYFKTRRYAGSKDRRAVRELVFRAIRRSGERPDSGRAAMVGLADDDAELLDLFDGSPHGPAPRAPARQQRRHRWSRIGCSRGCRPLVTPDEWPALLERAPLDLRVNVARTTRDAMLGDVRGRRCRPHSVRGALRLPPDTRVDDHPAFAEGLVEVQDEGSQLIALACQPADGMRILDLCAGAGGKALALAAAAPERGNHRLRHQPRPPAQLPPRAERAGATIADAAARWRPRSRATRRPRRPVRRGAGRCAVQRVRHLAPQPRRPLAADPRTARPVDQAAGAPARSRRAAGQAGRRAGLCHLLDHRAPKGPTRRATS